MANRDIQTALRLLASEINDAPYRITHRKGASDGAYLARKVVNSSWLLGLAAGIQDEVHRIEKAHRADVVKRQNRELFELSEPSTTNLVRGRGYRRPTLAEHARDPMNDPMAR